MDAKSSSKSSILHSTLRSLFSDEHAILAVLGIIVGVVGGYGAVGFRYFINFIQSIAYGSPEELLDVVTSVPWFWRIAIFTRTMALILRALFARFYQMF